MSYIEKDDSLNPLPLIDELFLLIKMCCDDHIILLNIALKMNGG